MSDIVTIRGNVGTEVHLTTTKDGVPMATFRVATSERYLDRDSNQWVDRFTNWYSVSAFRALAQNTACSIHKGDGVVVAGRLRQLPWKLDDGRVGGVWVQIDADTVGPDLNRGTVNFRRYGAQRPETAGGMHPGEERMTAEEALDQAEQDADVDTPDDPAELIAEGESVDSETGEVSSATAPF